MKKLIASSLLLFLTFFVIQTGWSINPEIDGFSSAEPKLYISTPKKVPGYLELTYEITMAGLVELHLFDPDGKKVWIKGRVTDRAGFDKILIPAKGLKRKGERYTFILKYKGKDYNGSFYAD